MAEKQTLDTIHKLGSDRPLAHATLFAHRHKQASPPFHAEIIELWHSTLRFVSVMAFRGAAKTTIAEEAITLGAAFRLFRNAILVGSTERRAVERLRAVKHELTSNELLRRLFGELGEASAKVWNDAEVILGNGVRIIAVGKGQSLRGTKHLQWRPDYCFCDDIEEVDVGKLYTDEEALETVRWFRTVLLPALDPEVARVRVTSTPLSKQALPFQLASLPGWASRTYPIEHVSPRGDRTATWPEKYDLAWIDAEHDSFLRLGLNEDYLREYMCQADDPRQKVFTADMIRVEPRVRTWQPVYMFYDPARSVKSTSATTGWCAWSWTGRRLTVWDGGGESWQPDQIIEHIFASAMSYSPVAIGVEEDGLNEFLLQPIRHEMIKRNFYLPIQAMKAPKGKLQFIEALQPYMRAGELTFAQELPVLRQQFLSFPRGKIDAPNALAYALPMRPGQVVYEDFGYQHVAESLLPALRTPVHLALNADLGYVTAVAAQFTDGCIHVLADDVREGDAGACVADMVAAARLDLAGGDLRLVAPKDHFGPYDARGLRGAVYRLPGELACGAALSDGTAEIRARMRTSRHGAPAFKVASRARWTLNALAAGYAREVRRDGGLRADPVANVYRVLMEGLEAFASLLKIGVASEQRGRVNYQLTPAGQRYISALPTRGGRPDEKADWIGPPGAVPSS